MSEMLVPLRFLLACPEVSDTHVCFRMDNFVATHCINLQGPSRSIVLLEVSEELFSLAYSLCLVLSVTLMPGVAYVWPGTLSRQGASAMECSLSPVTFAGLVDLFRPPKVDVFVAQDTHNLPVFLVRFVATPPDGPDAFTVAWNRWSHLYLFPSPTSEVLLQVCYHLWTFSGSVLLIAPLWQAQPWCSPHLQWCRCPQPLHLNGSSGSRSAVFGDVLRFSHVDFLSKYVKLSLSAPVPDVIVGLRPFSPRQCQSCW